MCKRLNWARDGICCTSHYLLLPCRKECWSDLKVFLLCVNLDITSYNIYCVCAGAGILDKFYCSTKLIYKLVRLDNFVVHLSSECTTLHK